MICSRCNQEVKVEEGLVILSCMPRLTPFRKVDQLTKVEGYTHGLGRRGITIWGLLK